MHISCVGFPLKYICLQERKKFLRMESDSEVDDRFAAVAGESEDGSEEEEEDEIEPPKKRKVESSRKRLEDSEMLQEKKKKPGVIYLSRSLKCSTAPKHHRCSKASLWLKVRYLA